MLKDHRLQNLVHYSSLYAVTIGLLIEITKLLHVHKGLVKHHILLSISSFIKSSLDSQYLERRGSTRSFGKFCFLGKFIRGLANAGDNGKKEEYSPR